MICHPVNYNPEYPLERGFDVPYYEGGDSNALRISITTLRY